MATFSPLIMGLSAAATAAGLMQQHASNKAENAALSRSRDQTEQQYRDAERDRLQRLARNQAALRAGSAAAGVSGDGSGAAAMSSLLAESDEEHDRLTRGYQNRMSEIGMAGRVNLLRQHKEWLNTGLNLTRQYLD